MMRLRLLGLLVSSSLLTAHCSLLTAAAAAAAESGIPTGGDRIEISFADFRFTPPAITLEQGRPYVLHFTNTSNHSHTFTATSFFQAAEVSEQDRSIVSKGRVSLGAGQSADVHLVAPPVGEYEAHCSRFLHASFGMKGQIVVQQAR